MFTQGDVVLLARVIDQYNGFATTPHILTEASNLANSLSSSAKVEWFRLLADFTLDTVERFTNARTLSRFPEFARFCIVDAALFELSESYQILTMDTRLSGYISSLNKPRLNFLNKRNTAS